MKSIFAFTCAIAVLNLMVQLESQAQTNPLGSCVYGQAGSCHEGESCVHFDVGKDVCVQSSLEHRVLVRFPFMAGTQFVCDQGNLSGSHYSHSWSNTAFALDLQGDRTHRDNPLFAGVSGVVVAYEECKTENDQCGAGFGNHVKILTDDDFIVFYAHMKMVSVKTGDRVAIGDFLGLEGTTGWTGEHNRHLHLSVHIGWKKADFDYWTQLGYLPYSAPFDVEIQNGTIVHSESMTCNRSSGK